MEKKECKYNDLQLAAFLITLGHPLLRQPYSEKENPHRYIFAFEDTSKLRADALNFINRAAMANAPVFADNLKHLKGLVMELRRGGGDRHDD